ncbi:MAG: RNA polymerase factor sigma-54 [Gammaproteobacteria bacterium]
MNRAPGLVAGLSLRPGLASGLAESLRLLALPGIELAHAIDDVLATNVLLERSEPATPPEMEFAPLGNGSSRASAQSDLDESEAAIDDLRGHLSAQIILERLSDRDFVIAEVIVDALDDDGYLRLTNAALAEAVDDALEPPPGEAEIEAVVHRVQHLDPTGVAARDPAECLLLQLAERSLDTPGLACAQMLLRDHFQALARGDDVALARLTGHSSGDVRASLDLIHRLDPHPGFRYSATHIEYLVPELIARRIDGDWRVEANPAVSPRLYVNRDYADWLAAHRGEPDATPLAAQLEEARLLIANLAQRKDTLLKIGQALVERQAAFLDSGPAGLTPLTMRELATELGLHESTVSRAVQGKSIACPRGTLVLRHFFSTAVSKLTQGGGLAAAAVQARIGQLIAAENPAAPLSDAALVAALAAEGTQVARRTVTKYREALGLTSTRERKRPGSQAI